MLFLLVCQCLPANLPELLLRNKKNCSFQLYSRAFLTLYLSIGQQVGGLFSFILVCQVVRFNLAVLFARTRTFYLNYVLSLRVILDYLELKSSRLLKFISMDSRDHKKERKSPASGLDSRMNSSDVSNAYTGDSITTGGPSKRCTRANSGIDAPLSDKQNKPRRNSFKPKGKFWRRPFGSITCQKETDGVKERRMCIDDAPYEETATDLEQWSEKEPFITSVWKVATNAFLDPPKYKQPRTAQKTLKVLGRRILGHRRPFDDTSDHENLSDDEDAKSFSSDSSFGDKYFEEEMQVLRQHRRLLEQKVRNVKDLAKHCTRKHQDYMTTLIDHWEGLSTQPPKEIDNTSEDPKKKFWSATPVDIRAMWRQNSELFQQRVRNLEQYFAQVTQQYIRCHDTVSFLERNFQTQRVGRRVYAVILELERNRYRLHLCQQSIVDITHNLFTPRRLEGPAANTEPGCRVWDCPSPQKCVNINAKLREMTGHFKAMKLSKPNQLLPLKVLPPKTFCNSPENRTWQQGPSGCDLLRPMLVVRLREHQSVRLSERSADRADSRLSGVDLRSEEAQLSPKARESPKIQEGSSPSTKLRTRKRKHRSPPMEAWWTEKRDGVLCDKENAQPKVRKLTPVVRIRS